jgi:hypothetical protein
MDPIIAYSSGCCAHHHTWADTMLVIRNVLSRGPNAGVFTTLGISSGLFVHATLSALGLSFILVRSAAAFDAVKLAGAAYLVYLGLRSIFQAARHSAVEPHGGDKLSGDGHKLPPWRSKPKAFDQRAESESHLHLAFLPQFIRAETQVENRHSWPAYTACSAWPGFPSFYFCWPDARLPDPSGYAQRLEALTGAVHWLWRPPGPGPQVIWPSRPLRWL